jgi:DNA-binding CsgD family transcriptional regulator
MDRDELRPLERRVLDLEASGAGAAEIGRRFHRSPEHIQRVIELAHLPHHGSDDVRGGLRPLERRVLRLREEGESFDRMGERFRRSPEHLARVAGYARYKLDGHA